MPLQKINPIPKYSTISQTTRNVVNYLNQERGRLQGLNKSTSGNSISTSSNLKPFDIYLESAGNSQESPTKLLNIELYKGIGEKYCLSYGGGFATIKMSAGLSTPISGESIDSGLSTFITQLGLTSYTFDYKALTGDEIYNRYAKNISIGSISSTSFHLYIFVGISRSYGSFLFYMPSSDKENLDVPFYVNEGFQAYPLYMYSFNKSGSYYVNDFKVDLRHNFSLTLMV